MAQFLEMLLLTTLTFYLLYRLWAVLGQEFDEDETRRKHKRDHLNAVVSPLPEAIKSTEKSFEQDPYEAKLPPSILSQYHLLSQKDPSFVLSEFIKGSQRAYQMILKAFEIQDLSHIRPYINETVTQHWQQVIDEWKKQGDMVHLRLENFDKVEVDHISLEEETVHITVCFKTRQVIQKMNRTGEITENPAGVSMKVSEVWTFQRHLNDTSPNWTLIETRSDT